MRFAYCLKIQGRTLDELDEPRYAGLYCILSEGGIMKKYFNLNLFILWKNTML